jgi:hypothetical protein
MVNDRALRVDEVLVYPNYLFDLLNFSLLRCLVGKIGVIHAIQMRSSYAFPTFSNSVAR